MDSREVAFMGRMTAGVTHEIKNVLAIIKESSGLLQDIIRLSKGSAIPKADQIEKVAARIRAQVARGNEQLTSLNWLAHSVSDRGSSIEINEMSSEIVNLMQRFARLKQVELEFQAADRDVTIHTDVAGLLVVLVACIEYYLNREPPKTGRVLLRPGGAGEEATLRIVTGSMDGSGTVTEIEAGGDPLPSELADLEPLLGSLGRLALADAEGRAELHLILPLRGDEDR